ncbi:MAG: hypothetical protein KF730_03365 [Sphingomonas sp.]|uniref:hypothetical protein n=1 Tax=Sphingomonas sp. TaxID=28214 RepID=UPI0025F19A08|nr:hypothetical protein [Sphingomonas sp.]MBX3563597.1 hypothetical protein [Sphingomonas sp.]
MSLSDFLDQFTPAGLPLGLVHCTPVIRGVQALNTGELRAENCPVYGESLVYLFYGRPAFKPLAGMAASSMAEHLPMCLVFDSSALASAERILPFDSGGFDRYAPSTGTLNREAFELAGGADTPPRLVAAFYETNLNYYRQMPTVRPEDISNLYPEARAIARLANDETIQDDDDRRTTIEVQFSRGVALRDSLVAIIGPAALEVEVPILRVLEECPNAVLRTYRTYGRQKALAHAGQLYELVEDFFRWRTLL